MALPNASVLTQRMTLPDVAAATSLCRRAPHSRCYPGMPYAMPYATCLCAPYLPTRLLCHVQYWPCARKNGRIVLCHVQY
eukprot:2258993-Rhodomonas_salina.6